MFEQRRNLPEQEVVKVAHLGETMAVPWPLFRRFVAKNT
jgi:hypothetical protein